MRESIAVGKELFNTVIVLEIVLNFYNSLFLIDFRLCFEMIHLKQFLMYVGYFFHHM